MAYEDLTPEQKLGLVVNLKKQQGGLLGGGGLSENVINLAGELRHAGNWIKIWGIYAGKEIEVSIRADNIAYIQKTEA